MIVLGIESSCDETAVAVLNEKKEVLSSLVSSQVKIHSEFGGVVPEIAARQHLKSITKIYEKALIDAKIKSSDIDLITVTQGPGLMGALLVGTSFAKGLASSLQVPLVPVNHVHAHVHGALLGLSNEIVDETEIFPSFAYVVSGGHTNLYYMPEATKFKLVASSKDDACGECFDKVGKLLGLEYPAGPKIEKIAAKSQGSSIQMPKILADKSRLEFSYSGLKTHLYYLLQKEPEPISEQRVADICYAFQEEAFSQLARKLKQVLPQFPEAKSLIVSGGVSANKKFKQIMTDNIPLTIHFPMLQYCSDNAAMIAAYGLSVYNELKDSVDYSETQSWSAYSRYDEKQM